MEKMGPWINGAVTIVTSSMAANVWKCRASGLGPREFFFCFSAHNRPERDSRRSTANGLYQTPMPWLGETNPIAREVHSDLIGSGPHFVFPAKVDRDLFHPLAGPTSAASGSLSG